MKRLKGRQQDRDLIQMSGVEMILPYGFWERACEEYDVQHRLECVRKELTDGRGELLYILGYAL
jgi:hypothetical protein